MPQDSHSDTSRDTVSLTYQELADRLGIDVQSARRRALRSRWAKVPGNDGKARVNVPAAVLPAAPATVAVVVAPAVAPAEAPPAAPVPATPEALSHLLSQVAEMGELRGRLGRAEAEAAALRERAERAEGESGTLREQVGAERERAAAAEREAAVRREAEAREQRAREAAERELAEWTAGGPLARALRALTFRRGR